MGIETIVAVAVGAAVGGGIAKAVSGGKEKGGVTAPLPMPKAPDPAEAAEKAQDNIKRKKSAATQTVYSNPLGVAGEAQVAKKMLLGQ